MAKSKKEELSFNDFLVAKVINGRDGLISHEMAKHWAPYYKICSPCTMGLDYIVRLDPTMEETKVNQGAFNEKDLTPVSFTHTESYLL